MADQTLVGTEFLFVVPIEYSSSSISKSYIIINNHETNMAFVSVKTPKDPKLLDNRLDITGNSFTKIIIPEDVFSRLFDPAQENSIYIEVTNSVNIDVTVVILTAYDSDSFFVFPLSLLGNSYNVIAPKMSNDSYSFVSIVFPDFSNQITLTFHKMVDLVDFNQTKATSITLVNNITAEVNIKYAYNVITLWYDDDLTGLQITSNTDIAVFAGCAHMTFLNNGNPKIFMIDQVPPTLVLGRDYIISRFGSHHLGGVFILTTSDNTSIIGYNEDSCMYHKGNTNDWDYYEMNSDILFISSSEPIAVVHILESGTSKPSMYYPTPMDGFQKSYEFYIPPSYEQWDIFGVTVFTSDSSSIMLNSQSVQATSTGSNDLDIGGVSYSALVYTPDPGQINRINHTSANFGGYVYYEHNSSLILHTLGGHYFQRNMTCKYGNNIPGCITPNTSCPYSAPSIRIANESSSILYGGNITLHCLIVAHPAITTFSWGINTSTGFTDITSGGSYTVETDTSAGNNGQANTTLTISNVTFVEKTYTCRAGNNIGDEFVSVTLYVLGDLKPNVKSPKYKTALSGAIISLPCVIVATPSVDYVYWTRTTSNKMIDMTKIRYSGSTTTSPSLNIDLARTSDTGVYNCHANNTVGSTKGPDLVLVVYDNTAVNDGGHYIMTGSNVTAAATTITTTATTAQNPIPVNTIATTYSTSNTSNMTPFVSARPLTLSANSGQNVTLTCDIIGPVTSVYWQKYQDGMVMKIDPTMHTTKISGATTVVPSLQIYGVSLYDKALYKCFAVNIDETGSSDYVSLDILDQTLVTFVHIPEAKKSGYLDKKKTEIEKELRINRKTLSSSIRRTTCAPDSRPSATAAGAVGASLMVVVFGTMALMDIPILISALKAFFIINH
ncbi:unnamed protein product [Mytilus edulis]|uniref:Ig-like domain-containing protein n=1 Tax=Mytilus edulis TaxID=6550 RepID=A0A8S3PZ69_MYTED|nr:unnamed protein product [Mytilus edulis]